MATKKKNEEPEKPEGEKTEGGEPEVDPRYDAENNEAVDAGEGNFVGVSPEYANAAVESHAPLDGEGEAGEPFAEAAEREEERRKSLEEVAEEGSDIPGVVSEEDADDSSDEATNDKG
jgi:hypothetical protein